MKPASQLLVAVQWGDQRAARACEFMDRQGFRVTMPFDPQVGQPVHAWFRDASSRGTGVEVSGRVSSIYHAFVGDDGHRLTISYAPGTASELVDRLVAMGVRHEIADRHLLPPEARPVAAAEPGSSSGIGAIAHTPRVGDGPGRGRLNGEQRIWSLNRLRPSALAESLAELSRGALLLPGVILAADQLDRVVLRVQVGEAVTLLPCEVRYQIGEDQGSPGVVLALGRVPAVLRAVVAELAGPPGSPARTPTGPIESEPLAANRVSSTPRPSRSRAALSRAGSTGPESSPAPRVRPRSITGPPLRISRAPIVRTWSHAPGVIQPEPLPQTDPDPVEAEEPKVPPAPSAIPAAAAFRHSGLGPREPGQPTPASGSAVFRRTPRPRDPD